MIREAKKPKKLVKYSQHEMFPSTFHEDYIVVAHNYYIIDGKSEWASSQIMWKVKK